MDPILRSGVRPVAERQGTETFIRLRWLAEKRIKRALEGVEGVAAVQVRGGHQEEIRVSVDPFLLDRLNLDLKMIGRRLQQENLNASGGQIRDGSTDYLVRTLNEFQDIEEIENLALVRRGGAVVRVRDVAKVSRTYAEREVVTRLDGAEAVEIAIYREAGAGGRAGEEVPRALRLHRLLAEQRRRAVPRTSGRHQRSRLAIGDRSQPERHLEHVQSGGTPHDRAPLRIGRECRAHLLV